MKLRNVSTCLLLVLLFAGPAPARLGAQEKAVQVQPLASPAFPRGLTAETADLVVRGRTGQNESVFLDLKTIMALPSVSFHSLDPWDGKEHGFTGIPLKQLMAWIGIDEQASRLILTARNKYSIPVRREDYEKHGYILAYMIDGKAFSAEPSTKKRGPLAIAIDFSKNPELASDLYKHQLVWQLVDILVQ